MINYDVSNDKNAKNIDNIINSKTRQKRELIDYYSDDNCYNDDDKIPPKRKEFKVDYDEFIKKIKSKNVITFLEKKQQ
jgi:hypothetical protein